MLKLIVNFYISLMTINSTLIKISNVKLKARLTKIQFESSFLYKLQF